MDVTPRLKSRFCKDYKLPIKIFSEPYFSDRLELIDSFYNAKEKYQRFVSALVDYPNEQAYMEEYNRVKDEAIAFITDSPQCAMLQKMPASYFVPEQTQDVPKKDIYKTMLIGHRLVSIDMKQANFHALLHFSSEMFGFAKTWEEFIRRFTDNEHIIQSKYVREVILGHCAVKRQVALEHKLMCNLFNLLSNLPTDPVYLGNDEIVLDITRCADQKTVIRDIESRCREWMEIKGKGIIQLRIEPFTLWGIHGTDGYIRYVEDENDGWYDIKGVNSKMMPFVIRHLKKEPVIQAKDAVFIDDNKLLAMYLQVPDIRIIKERHDTK